MARIVHKKPSEIMLDYENLPDASARSNTLRICCGEDGGATAAGSGRNLYRLVAVSFGLLCVLQAALNISLRLALYGSNSKTPDVKASCTNLTEDTDRLKRQLIHFDEYFRQGWVYFHPSLYYISSIKKSWQESRADCLQRGADLVVINSREEQDFTRKFYRITWIGLTETKRTRNHQILTLLEGREIKRTWKWVDGTPLTESFWGPGEPNGFEGKNEDCVEIKYHDLENSWNDISCEDQNFWICEKVIAS